MNSLEVNKALAAVLVAGIVFSVSGLVSGALVHPARLEKTAIAVQGVQEAAPGAAAAPEPQDPPVEALLVSASPQKGQADTQRLCTACHTFNQGGHAGVGPNLYGVVGLKHGHMEGFSYSSALLSKQGPWTFDELYQWLKSPRAYAPGTKMSFAGIDNPKERADVIAFLNQNSDHPEALPKPPAAAPAAAAATTGTKPPVAASQAVRAPNAAPRMPANGGKPGAGGPAHMGQNTQAPVNQNMPGAAAAQTQQPPLARNLKPGNSSQAGQPQPSPAARTP